MKHTINLSSSGSFIIVDSSSLYVSEGDTVEFKSLDGDEYDIVIPNKDTFFVSQTGETIEETATETQTPETSQVNSKPGGTTKYYSVTTPGGQNTCAPPRIILIT